MANSHDPHRPLAGSEQELKVYGRHMPASRVFKPEEVEVPRFLPDIPEVRREIAQYYTSAHRLDETVGAIIRALRDSGLEENTMVMFLSDNGMAFPFAKTNCYLNSTKTPWMCRWPGKVKPGTLENSRFVSGIDFMPTVLEAAGLEPVEGMDGHSFLKLLLGEPCADEEEQGGARTDVFTMFNQTSARKDFPMRCVQNAKNGYIYNGWSDQQTMFKNESMTGLTYNAMKEAAASDAHIRDRVRMFEYRVKEELYDLEADPDSLVNLSMQASPKSSDAGCSRIWNRPATRSRSSSLVR